MQKKQNVSEIIREFANPIAESLNLKIWDVKFLKEGSSWYLRVFIDKSEGGVTLEDCEKMSRALDEPLDVLDPIKQSYCLEVCSPGIERELTCDAHLKEYMGSNLKISLFNSIEDNKKTLFGKLISFNKDEIIIKNSDEFKIPRKNISKINLNIEQENIR